MKRPSMPFVVCAALGAALLCSCLPDDTRAPPASVLVTLAADESLLAGIPSSATVDGWSIEYERFLVVLGGASLDGDDCDAYSESDYARIFDVMRPEPQRVSLLYGLGQCDFGFRITSPAWDTLRGEGVSAEDETLLRTAGSDAFATDQAVTVHVAGNARKLEQSKRFVWSFRRFIEYERCRDVARGIALSQEQSALVELSIHGAALFQDQPDASLASLRFEPFREADDVYGDADGLIALDELARTPLGKEGSTTLLDLLYLELLPELARYRGSGTCNVTASSEPPDFGGP